MATTDPDALKAARIQYIIALLSMLALFVSFFAFCLFVPTVDPSDGRWQPRTRMNLFYWQHTPDGISLKFSHQLGKAMLTSLDGYERVEYNRGFKQFPRDTSPLISAMYVSEHWLSAEHYPPDMHIRFDKALATVTDEREAYCLRYCFDKATTSGRILWLGVLRNLAVLFLLIVLAVSIVRSSRASTNLRAVKLALKKSSCLCGYSLIGLNGDKCPECGRVVITPAQSASTLDA